jgi:hypothetical protein
VPYRPLALVCVLAGGDYLLWNWSLQGNHDVLSLVSGLTLPPLAIALAWLLALNATRLLARIARAPRQQSLRNPRTARTPQQLAAQQAPHQGGDLQQGDSASSKLAA